MSLEQNYTEMKIFIPCATMAIISISVNSEAHGGWGEGMYNVIEPVLLGRHLMSCKQT